MVLFTTTSGLVLGLMASTAWAQTLTASMIEKMGNNSLFTQWRPYSHISAPAGWMNDPCGPLYDPVGGLYHMHYQFHPNHANWGNISWGHATSHDMISWTDVDHFPKDSIKAWSGVQAQSIGTTNLTSKHHPPQYNRLGIFSGTAQPVNLTGEMDGTLLAFYTSVSELPFSWNAPYPKGAESQSLAYSTDGGVSWQEYSGNPVLSQPPGGWNITGWRDPFFLPIPKLDALLKYSEPHYYVIFGSGIGGVGPRVPLYAAPASNLTNWNFLGALWEPTGNTSISGNIFETGSYGWQFEVPDFFNLGDYWFISTGTQGGSTTYHPQNWAIWNEGTISARSNGSVEFTPISGGAADWGILYAVTSFNDTKNNRRIQIGWAWEDMNSFGIIQQGYQGALSLPRELFIMETPDVVPPMSETPSSSVYTKQLNGTYTARTLGARPATDVIQGLRKGSKNSTYNIPTLSGKGNGKNSHMLTTNSSHSYEISLVIESTSGRTGVTIGASPDFKEYTSIYYDPSTSSIVCNRTYSSLITEFLNTSYVGYFAPYSHQKRMTVSPTPEVITLRVFVDGSLVEIFANDRFAMTSRIYPSRMDSKGVGLYAALGVKVTYSGAVQMWNGLANVWPRRPLNSSSLLVYDTAAETNNYTWWSGN